MPAPKICDGFSEAVGNTPLIKLRKLSEQTGCTILGKAEFLNPGGSVKDRAGLYMILDAEERGELKPGGVVVEGTAGNTGIGLALAGNARGYRTVILMPDTQSQEKKDMLRLCGAEVHEVPAVPFKNPGHYVHQAERMAEELAKTEPNGVIYANQWDNLANRGGHVKSTGPEIWEQTAGKVDGFICAIGTGGTLSGVGQFLKERNPNVQVGLADPKGACMYEYFKNGEVKATDGGSISEGIGQGRVTGNVDGAIVDHPVLDSRRRGTADRLRPAEGRGPVPRQLDGDQRRRREAARRGTRAGPHDRDDPRRRRTALPEQALQPGFPEGEGVADSGLAVSYASLVA